MAVAIDCEFYNCYKERGEQRPLKMMAIDHEDEESHQAALIHDIVGAEVGGGTSVLHTVSSLRQRHNVYVTTTAKR